MANEIKLTTKITFDKGSVAGVKRDETDKSFDVSGSKYSQTVQNVNTSEEAIALGDIVVANLGYCHIKNLDATNFISIRPGTGLADMLKLKPSESCLFRWEPGITPFWIADTGTCDVEILIIED